eukprot:181018_1
MSPSLWLCHAFFIVNYVVFVASYQSCFSPNACTGLFLNDTDYTRASGYKSAIGPNTSHSGERMICTGSYSCESMAFIESAGLIFCSGANSCANVMQNMQTNRSSPTSAIYCRGSNSCAFSNIITNDLWCSGHRSCANSHISGTSIIWGSASFSLYNSTIDTNESLTSTILVRLRGRFAGYGGTLLCRANHTCTVECMGIDACAMFYVDCQGTCIYNDYSIAPTTNITAFIHRNRDISSYSLFDSEIMEPNSDMLCIDESSAFDLDGERYVAEDLNITVDGASGGPICCRASDACNSVDRIGYQMPTRTGNDVICSGSTSCVKSIIMHINETVYCEAYAACRESTIAYVTNVYCDGFSACSDANITNVENVVCRGESGCEGTTFISGGSDLNIYFSGTVAGQRATVHCTGSDKCDIHCLGGHSCIYLTVYCEGDCTIQCEESSVLSCPTIDPSSSPTLNPSQTPSAYPSLDPTVIPSKFPTDIPTEPPTAIPSKLPTDIPSKLPTDIPSKSPTDIPSKLPTNIPSKFPTNIPSKSPTDIPSKLPTDIPSKLPTDIPSKSPTDIPSKLPTNIPSKFPTNIPSKSPTDIPSKLPTDIPSKLPTDIPSKSSDIPPKFPTIVAEKSPTNIPVQSSAEYRPSTAIETTKGIEEKEEEPTTNNNTAAIVVISIILFVILALGTAIWRLLKRKKTVQVATANMAIDQGDNITTTKRDSGTEHNTDDKPKAEATTVEMVQMNNTPQKTETAEEMKEDSLEDIHEDMYVNGPQQVAQVTATGGAEDADIPQHVYAEQVHAEELCAATKGSMGTATGQTTGGEGGNDGEGTDEEEGESNEVKEWLDKKVEMMEYYQCFVNNGLTSLMLIKNIEDISDLQNVGIVKIEHQYAIMHHINQLKK